MFHTGLRYTLLLIGFAATLSACAGSPNVGSYDEKAEVERGSRQHAVVTAVSGAYPRDEWLEYVTAVGNRLAAASERPNLRWHFAVLDSPKPNAFATRGGYVYITRGMLALLRSENDLAAVLAHEIAHISAQDASRAQTRKDAAILGTLGTALAFAPVALLAPQAAPASAGTAAYTRRDELEADRHGADYLRRAGYVPESMSSALTIVANLEAFNRDHRKSGKPGAGWTHRVLADEGRLGQAESQVRDIDPQYLARLEGMEFGPNPRSAQALDETDDLPKPPVLRIRKVHEGDSFASLAGAGRAMPNAEAVLRLINLRYPDGELVPGQLVKVIE